MFAARAMLLIATFWIGSLWTIGYLVAPTLFATLTDRALAGTIAGQLFRIEAWVSVLCAPALVGLFRFSGAAVEPGRKKRLIWLALAMLLCTLIGYFGLHPLMAELRSAAPMDADTRARFGMLHGVSSGFYLIQSLLGVALILRLR
jgi:hypothetical protein